MESFALVIGLVSAVLALAVLSNRLGERLGLPAPIFFLVGGVAAAAWVPGLGDVPIDTVQRAVSVALVAILFDGGLHIGVRRFRPAAGSILWLGVAGTLVTAAALAAAGHWLLHLDWYLALLLGTALAPTDPAVVFSVLGRREIAGRSGTLLEGESGANDPVGIALMAALLGAGAGASSVGAQVGAGLATFALQMGVGLVVGVVGARLLLWFMRVPLPSESLYLLRTAAGAGLVYGAATALHGSGFLAVFVAGIALGDVRAPYKREIERFHAALASLGEIVAFALLGLTVPVVVVLHDGWWLRGLALAVVMALVVRPLLVGPLLLPLRLGRRELVFVLWAGLKGAVPIVLGTFILTARGDPAALQRVYALVCVVVAFSVVVQGASVPWLVRRLRLPVRLVEPEPFSLGVRLTEEPEGVHRVSIAEGAEAAGRRLEDLDLDEDVWIVLVVRAGRLEPVRAELELAAGDEVLCTAPPDRWAGLDALFARPAQRAAE